MRINCIRSTLGHRIRNKMVIRRVKHKNQDNDCWKRGQPGEQLNVFTKRLVNI
jgi:hypothetical protein